MNKSQEIVENNAVNNLVLPFISDRSERSLGKNIQMFDK